MFLPLHDTNPIRHVDFPFVTYGLMGVTILAFLIQSILPPTAFDQATINFGMIPIVVRDLYPAPVPWLPDWANLVTYSFLHADWMHLLSNMLFLWVFGDNIEDAFGHFKFLIFYLALRGAGGSGPPAVQSRWQRAADRRLGRRGRGHGRLYPALSPCPGFRAGSHCLAYSAARAAFWMLGFWIATQLFFVIIGSDEPVAWWAHLGGFAAGLVLAPPVQEPQCAAVWWALVRIARNRPTKH